MLSKSVVRLAFVSCLMASPAAFAATSPAAPMDLPPAPAGAPADQSMATPAPTDPSMPTTAPMDQSMATPAPMDQAAPPGAPQTDLVTNGPQANPGDHGRNWSAARNVRESRWYDHLVATNGRFRQFRERKECGPINDAQLHSQCMASFQNGGEAPMYGSSTPPNPIRNSSGASE
jgi:hypothetical protein